MNKREITVVETPPTQTDYYRKFMLATDDERLKLQKQNPELIIRKANEDELKLLHAEVEVETEDLEG